MYRYRASEDSPCHTVRSRRSALSHIYLRAIRGGFSAQRPCINVHRHGSPLTELRQRWVDTSRPVNKDHKISNPVAPIGRGGSRGRDAQPPIGRPPRGCEDVLNDAPQCTWLTKSGFSRGRPRLSLSLSFSLLLSLSLVTRDNPRSVTHDHPPGSSTTRHLSNAPTVFFPTRYIQGTPSLVAHTFP